MSTRARLWLITGLTAFLFVVATWMVNRMVEPAGNARWIVLGGLSALGLTASGIVYRFLSLRWKDRIRREKIAKREDQIAQAFVAARKRLSDSKRAESPKVGKLPLVLLLGPQGSTKTTAVVRSGLDPELLAGEVHQGDAVVPTETVNLWFAENTVFLEAGGRLLDQEERWEAVLDHAQPSRLGAVLGRGTQASRVAVVCVGCDEFLKPGAAEAIPALARKLRDRLVAGAQALGIQLPVYVLFTRADRLPYFEDYVRSLSKEEASQALGSIVPMEDPSRLGVYAEVQARRVDDAMDGILHNLALNRREVIRRESDPEVQAGAYEFPRELAKASGLIERFLVDLCRPSQLTVSPFLRGFYFTGVRAIVVNDPGAAPAAAAPDFRDDAPMGATMVFDASKLRSGAAPTPPSRTRRVPDWVFLEPVFRDVLLADRSARAVTSGGTRVDFLRRSLLTAATLVALFVAGAFTVSFIRNDGLADRTVAAAEDLADLDPSGDRLPALSDLQALEELRGPVDTLWTWEGEGPPASYRWGLWVGGGDEDGDLRPAARRAYVSAFERIVGDPARAALVDTLQALPEEPGAATDYGAAYNGLRAYLVMTERPEHSTPDFLTPAVLERWPGSDYPQESEAADLLARQLDLYARLIVDENPSAREAEGQILNRARAYLSQFAGTEPLYQSMLMAAANQSAPSELGGGVSSGSPVVTAGHVVPASFTKSARNWVQTAQVRDLFPSEEWVLGGPSRVVPTENQADSLRERYNQEYLEQWTAFLASLQVRGFVSYADAANKLERLSSVNSPLLDLLEVASNNTFTEAEPSEVREAFGPLHSVVQGDSAEIRSYTDALRLLRAAMERVQRADRGSRPMELGEAGRIADATENAVRTLADGFEGGDTGRPVQTALMSLLHQPVGHVRRLMGSEGARALNEKGADFCARYEALLGGFPFEAGDATPASVDNVIAALGPENSHLSRFFEEDLSEYLVVLRSGYDLRTGVETDLNPAFVDFLNRTRVVQNALFDPANAPDDVEGPWVTFTLRPEIPEGYTAVRVEIDGVPEVFTQTTQDYRLRVWEPDPTGTVQILGQRDGANEQLLSFSNSPWAIFQLFDRAEWSPQPDPRSYRVRWDLDRGVTLSATIQFAYVPHPVFDPSFLQRATPCVERVALR